MCKRYVVKGVKIEEVELESVTGRDILDPNGNMILARGTRLTLDLINGLKRLGISTIPVQREQEIPVLDPGAREEEMRRVDALVERKFRFCPPDDRITAGLKEVCRDFFKGKAGRGAG